jgi:NitT/TauT family transport system substrate-binding protein
MKKFICLLLAMVLVFPVLASCAKEQAPDTVRVYTLKGPTGIGMAKMIADAKNEENPLYDFTIAAAPDVIQAEIIKGEYEIAALPTNLAAALYNKTEGALVVAAVNTLGVLYVLENGNTIQSVQDLAGKTIYATGQGSTPEYILNYILAANNIECEIIYFTEHAELATQMAAGNVVIGMLPVPNSTTVLAKNADVRVALNLTEEWEKAAVKNGDDGALYQGCLVIRREFAEQYPETVKKFLADYKASVAFIHEDLDLAAETVAACELIPSAAVAKKAIPDANIVCITGEEMIQGLSGFFKVLHGSNPKSVGGKLPDENIFYSEK